MAFVFAFLQSARIAVTPKHAFTLCSVQQKMEGPRKKYTEYTHTIANRWSDFLQEKCNLVSYFLSQHTISFASESRIWGTTRQRIARRDLSARTCSIGRCRCRCKSTLSSNGWMTVSGDDHGTPRQPLHGRRLLPEHQLPFGLSLQAAQGEQPTQRAGFALKRFEAKVVQCLN